MKRIFKLVLVMLIGITLMSCTSNVKVSLGSEDIIGSNYSTVVTQLQEDGFKNIKTEVIEDLTTERSSREGLIESISIGDVDNFVAKTSFPQDSTIVITYHSIKKVNPPFSYSDINGMSLEDVRKAMEKSGFENIEEEEVYDLNPEDNIKESIEVSIDGDSNFDVLDELPYDSQVKIIKHYPCELYTLKLNVECRSNLIFSTYDVAISIGTDEYVLEHGKTDNYELKLQKGTYTITFANAEDSEVKGTASIDISSNTEASYYIWCESNKVDVTEKYIDREVELSDEEIKMPNSLAFYKDMSYSEAEASLKALGFTKVTTVPQYDIVFGFTKEGSIEKITIGDKTDFTKGNIFKKNDAVTIVYHLKEDDDPSKPTPTPTPKSTPNATSSSSTGSGWSGHSSDNMQTAKKGNSGVYAFKTNGSSYDTYIIIDFDEGYVYHFLQGDGNTYCDKIKIDSGDLNNGLFITYHNGNDSWQENFHFKWKNQPDHLVYIDGKGFDIDLYYTDLSTALSYKNGKTVYEY